MLNELALFAGAGGGILGGTLLGWRTVCAVEIDPYCAGVLVARQNDGLLPPFPIWDDVRTFDGKPWAGIVDVVSGGFPCQDISCAGKGDGLDGERSGLWKEFARIVGEVRPRFVFVENSPVLVVRGGNRVLGDLAALGYDARWGIVSAADAGAPHLRKRIWILATDAKRRELRNEPRWICGESGTGATEFADNGEQGIVADADGCLRGWRADEQGREAEERVVTGGGGEDVDHANGTGCSEPQEGDPRQGEQREGERNCGTAAGAGWWQFIS